TEEEAERHTYKNVILQALGASPNVNVIVDKVVLRDLDILVLCSDGLSNKMRGDEMMQVINKAHSLKEACDDLIKVANERGGEDNITVVIAQVNGGSLIAADANGTKADRWGAETIPRDPDLPYEIDLGLVDDEEETIPPTEKLDGPA
ncbi:MAG TPA: SpoIIE family protein phosphatase, partial [Blastocatellia bacterium]